MNYATLDQDFSESNPIIFESMSPNIYVSDIRRTISFYRLLGFHIIDSVPNASDPSRFTLCMGLEGQDVG